MQSRGVKSPSFFLGEKPMKILCKVSPLDKHILLLYKGAFFFLFIIFLFSWGLYLLYNIYYMNYITKDSWNRQSFDTWMVRDTQDNKPRIDLISPFFLKRLWLLLARWAEKYNARNWELGCDFQRLTASMMRHTTQWMEWDKTEDHLAAVCFNAMAIIHFQETGRLDLDNMPEYTIHNKE